MRTGDALAAPKMTRPRRPVNEVVAAPLTRTEPFVGSFGGWRLSRRPRVHLPTGLLWGGCGPCEPADKRTLVSGSMSHGRKKLKNQDKAEQGQEDGDLAFVASEQAPLR